LLVTTAYVYGHADQSVWIIQGLSVDRNVTAMRNLSLETFLRNTPDEWHAFIGGAKHGDFDGLSERS
jgi:hypothetical protein